MTYLEIAAGFVSGAGFALGVLVWLSIRAFGHTPAWWPFQ